MIFDPFEEHNAATDQPPLARLPEVLSPKHPGELRAALGSSLVFTVVRHPLTRLVSAYR